MWILAPCRRRRHPWLIRGTIAAARNAQDLLNDAQVLAEAGCPARAYSLAALAVEEAGKASSLSILTMMLEDLRARAPVGRMLEWHQLKQAAGLFIAAVPCRIQEIAPTLAAMPAGELAQFLTALRAPADEADRLKRRGLYVDVGRGGKIREPSEITETDVISQLAQAGQVTSAAGQLLEPETQALLADPVAEMVELSRAAVSALTEARCGRTPEAAADVVLNMVGTLRDRTAAIDAEGTPVTSDLRPRRHQGHLARVRDREATALAEARERLKFVNPRNKRRARQLKGRRARQRDQPRQAPLQRLPIRPRTGHSGSSPPTEGLASSRSGQRQNGGR